MGEVVTDARGGPHDYLICSTHRSGSNLLCDLLRGSRVAGRPVEHILRLLPHGGVLDQQKHCDIVALLPPSSWSPVAPERDLIAEARRRATRDGVFGSKIMLPNFVALGNRLGLQPSAELFRLLTPNLLCVHIVRRDKLAQAVSCWAAMQSGAWHCGQPGQREPVYSYPAIDHLRRLLEDHDASWLRLFSDAGIAPHTVTYDELVADRTNTVRGVLRYIGVESGVEVPPPALRPQVNALSAEWIARYRRDSQVAVRARVLHRMNRGVA